MEFPDYHFYAEPNAKPKQREYFLYNYGTCKGLNIADTGEPQHKGGIKHTLQHECYSDKLSKKSCLKASLPTLPLLRKPNDVAIPYQDRICDAVMTERQKVADFVRLVKFHKTFGAKKGPNTTLLQELKKQLTPETDYVNRTHLDHMPWFQKLLDLYSDIRDVKYLPRMNSEYSGGCLKYLPCGHHHFKQEEEEEEEHCIGYMIQVARDEQYRIKLHHVTSEKNGQVSSLSSESCVSVDVGHDVFELDSKQVHENNNVVLRGSDTISLWRMCQSQLSDTVCTSSTAQQTTNVDFLKIRERKVMSRPTSVCLSPFLSGECLVADIEGSVYLWSANGSFTPVIKERLPRFHCAENWSQCQFAAHPRLACLANRSCVEILDIRSSTCSDLFSLPSKYVENSERIMQCVQHPDNYYYHIVATDHMLFMMDQRFINHPVLQWNNMLQCPPQYLSIATSVVGNTDVLLVASQLPAETLCFQFSIANCGQPPISRGLPWKLAKISHFPEFPILARKTDQYLVGERFSGSLGGVCAVRHHDNRRGFTAFQLDVHDDMFYQSYHPDSDSVDKTISAGPGCRGLHLPSGTVDIASEWLQELKSQVDHRAKQKSAEVIERSWNASAHFEELVFNRGVPHMRCPLCMPSTSGQPLDPLDVDDVCRGCGMKLHVAWSLRQSVQQDIISPNNYSDYGKVSSGSSDEDVTAAGVEPDPFEGVLPDISEIIKSPDPTSEIYLRIWNGQPIGVDILKKQDEIRIALRDQKRKDRREKKAKRQFAKQKIEGDGIHVDDPSILPAELLERLQQNTDISDDKSAVYTGDDRGDGNSDAESNALSQVSDMLDSCSIARHGLSRGADAILGQNTVPTLDTGQDPCGIGDNKVSLKLRRDSVSELNLSTSGGSHSASHPYTQGPAGFTDLPLMSPPDIKPLLRTPKSRIRHASHSSSSSIKSSCSFSSQNSGFSRLPQKLRDMHSPVKSPRPKNGRIKVESTTLDADLSDPMPLNFLMLSSPSKRKLKTPDKPKLGSKTLKKRRMLVSGF